MINVSVGFEMLSFMPESACELQASVEDGLGCRLECVGKVADSDGTRRCNHVYG